MAALVTSSFTSNPIGWIAAVGILPSSPSGEDWALFGQAGLTVNRGKLLFQLG